MDFVAEVTPELVREAAVAALAIASASAAGGIHRFVDCIDNVGDRDLFGIACEQVSAPGPANTVDQEPAPQLCKQLLQVRERNLLARRDFSETYRVLLRVQRQIQHGGDGVSAFGGEAHGWSSPQEYNRLESAANWRRDKILTKIVNYVQRPSGPPRARATRRPRHLHPARRYL